MTQRLSHLHDSHYGGVDLVLPILEDALGGAHLLLHLDTRGNTGAWSETAAACEAEQQLLLTVSFIWI